MSLFINGESRKAMKKIGVNMEHVACLYENGAWYQSNEVYEKAAKEIEKEVKKGFAIKKLIKSCEAFRKKNKKILQGLIKNKKITALGKLKKAVEILQKNTTYIWFAHDYEYYLTPILKREIPKYFSGNIDKVIGDLSFPDKKSQHNYLEEELLAGVDLNKIAKKYGWIKARDSFTNPFTVAELAELKENLLKEKKTQVPKLKIPPQLKKLIRESKDLVYYRTLRTDVYYELLFIARPIFEEVAKFYGLTYKQLRNYSVYDLLSGNLKEYPNKVTCAYCRGQAAFFEKPILPEEKITDETIKGAIAFSGNAKGVVKVVRQVDELDKVKAGDILVTFMTAPSHISAMKRAIAFVTDEGGITCHAAIVAREMKKPCIIGTKIATKVLKDGDMVEVDADRGIVKIIK